MDFNELVQTITSVHDELSVRATKAVNFSLTVRNWLIGYYIQEFEQKGSDRASYGDHILQDLSSRLPQREGFSHRSLKLYRQFYTAYPQFGQTVFALRSSPVIRQTLSAPLPDCMPSPDNRELKGDWYKTYERPKRIIPGLGSFCVLKRIIPLLSMPVPVWIIRCLSRNIWFAFRELRRSESLSKG